MSEQALVVGILSIGDMGLGIAKLLLSQGYQIATFAEDRSERTRDRAQSNGIQLLPSIKDLVSLSAVLLSIVPPKDALATAQRVLDQTSSTRQTPLYYLDLNATAPSLATRTQALLSSNPNIILLDGGIIGGPPYPNPSPATKGPGNGKENEQHNEHRIPWTTPSLITSGPTKLPYPHLTQTLNIDHMSSDIGAASGLKMCFASTTKGFFALAIQSYVTAESMGVFPELRKYMRKHNPQTLEIADKGVVGMPPKAYRWVNEMQQIGKMMEEEGGWGRELFDGVAEVYRVVADDTALGLEQTGRRERGRTVDDVVAVMREGMEATKKGKSLE